MAGIGFSDYAADQSEIERRRKYAEMLRDQSQQPLGTEMAGGWAIPNSPTQYLAKALQAYTGKKGLDTAKTEQQALQQRMRTEATNWAAGIPQAQTRDLNLVSGDDEGNAMPAALQTTQPSKQEMLAFALRGMTSGNPLVAPMAGPMAAQYLKPDEDFTLGEGQRRFRGGQEIAAGGPRTFAPPAPVQPKAPLMNNNFPVGNDQVQPHISYDNGVTWQPLPGSQPAAKFAKQVGSTTINAAPVTPVTIADPKDPNNTIIVDGRTGRQIGQGPKLTQSGAAQQKLAIAQPQAKLRVDSMTQNIDKLDQALGELDADPGLVNITGPVMGRTPNLTSKATGAQAKLNSVKSQIFVSALQAMREASKTGGAVGNVSDREGDKLENTLAALDQAQGTPDFRKQLAKARQQLGVSKALIQNAYNEQYGDGSEASPAAPGGSPIRKYNPATGKLE